jgi:seryl-tRNA synthetase
MQPVKQFETARDTALAQPADKWTLKEEQIKSAYGKEISRAQTSTMKKVRHLQNKIMKEVSKTLQRGQDKVTSLKNKEKAAETVVEYDKKQADLEHQLAEVQARAAARAQALERKLAAVDTIEKKFASNPNKPLLARRAARTPAAATLLAATSNGASWRRRRTTTLKTPRSRRSCATK